MAFAGGSLTDQLLAVEQAIDVCLEAQSYSVSGRSKQTADLKSLREFRKELLVEISETSGDYGFVLNQVDSPSSV